jgi:hypothetical protein
MAKAWASKRAQHLNSSMGRFPDVVRPPDPAKRPVDLTDLLLRVDCR